MIVDDARYYVVEEASREGYCLPECQVSCMYARSRLVDRAALSRQRCYRAFFNIHKAAELSTVLLQQ